MRTILAQTDTHPSRQPIKTFRQATIAASKSTRIDAQSLIRTTNEPQPDTAMMIDANIERKALSSATNCDGTVSGRKPH